MNGSLTTALLNAFKSESAGDPTYWMPLQASTSSPAVDFMFYFILWICVFFYALIILAGALFILKYRRRKEGEEPPRSASHNTALEITWTAIPFVLVIVIFILGFKTYMDLAVAPEDAYEIEVTGKKWTWSFTYPNGYVDNQLHVPMNRPVKLLIGSSDVIHSVFIPAFRIKKDAVPGRYTMAWFQAVTAGEYDLFCAEYCGQDHSAMITKVIVHKEGEFEPWLAEASDFLNRMTPAEAGKKLYQVRGCGQCHSLDGTYKVGPTFEGMFGQEHEMADGSKVMVDENYIRESILNPKAKIRAGYQPTMPTYQGQLRDDEISAIIAFLKTVDEQQ